MFRLLRLIRRRQIAYELLAEYDADNLPADPERFKRTLEVLSTYAAAHPVTHGGTDEWRTSIERLLARYPSG